MTTLEQRLGQARASLVALPDLVDELARCRTERVPVDGVRGKPGSRAPLRLDVIHLTDDRRKPGWLDDPREVDLSDRFGVAIALESWSRIVAEEMPNPPEQAERPTVRTEAAVLIEAWDWITEQQWASELAEDVRSLAGQVRSALGIRPEYHPRCRYCRFRVEFVDERGLSATPETFAYGRCTGCEATFPKGPAMDALGRTQPALPLAEVARVLGIPVKTLHRWHSQQIISPAPESNGGRNRVFDLAEVRQAAARVRRLVG